MHNRITRYDIHLSADKEQTGLDFILNRSDKRIIHGTVWNDDLSDPKPEEEALVFVYLPGKNYDSDPLDIVNIGYVVTDKNGEFFAGPFEAKAAVILKVYKMNTIQADFADENSYRVNTP